MTKSIKFASFFIILIVVACAIFAVNEVNNRRIDDVEKLSMSQSTSTTATISWKKVKKADGYRIYIKNADGSFELFEEVSGEDIESYDFTQINPASLITTRVTAFKYYRDKCYESENAEELTIYTLPEKATLEALSSNEGELLLKWNTVENVTGYELQYGMDSEFADAQLQDFTEPTVSEYKLENLTPKDVYYSRVRGYFVFDKEKVYAQWSDTAEVTIIEKVVMPKDIDPNKPMVALSFDDGPGYYGDDGLNPTEEILNVLEEYNARATFFMCASRINSSSNFLERELAIGCELGNHTYDHKHYSKKVTASDISSCSDKIKELCGSAPTIFRCPGGIMSGVIKDECIKEGMPIAYWSVDTKDWETKDANKTYDNCMNSVYDGCIILMHDIYPSTAEAIKRIVPDLIKEGYQVVTITELITYKGGEPPKPGEQYVNYNTINNNT